MCSEEPGALIAHAGSDRGRRGDPPPYRTQELGMPPALPYTVARARPGVLWRASEPLVGRRVERVFKQLLGHARLPTTFTPHSLRHSTATYLTAMDVPPRVIMEIMGHSSLAMTSKYQHVMESMLDHAADRLANITSSRLW